MRKFLLLLFTILLCSPAMAETVIVEALNDISTLNPPSVVKLKILSNIVLDDNLTLMKGDIAEGKVINVKDPKRLKRNATFSVQLLSVHQTGTGNVIHLKDEYIGKYTTELNKADIAKSAALTVGNYFIHGISAGFTVVEGAVKNEENNRLKSSAVALYESSPVSYIEKGTEIHIKTNEAFYLKFKTCNDLI